MGKVKNILEQLEKNVTAKLARGNVKLQRGNYRTDSEWEKIIKNRPEKLRKLKHFLYPEKY